MPVKEPVIQLQGITFRYPGADPVLKNLNFHLHHGDRIGLAASNGSGKTTLFHVIMGLLKPIQGTIRIFGKPVQTEKEFREVRQKVGLLFQDADDQLFSPTVLEDVAFGPLNMGKSIEEAIAISKRILSYLGLDGFEDRITIKLSGGEKRLVSLATILAMEPEVLLLDEPTSGLDEKTKARITRVLSDLKLSYMIISHEFDFLSAITDHVYTMEDGKILIDEELHVHVHQHAHKVGRQPHKHI